MKLKVNDYEVIIKRGILDDLKNYTVDKETVIITDDLIPKEYIKKVESRFKEVFVITIPHGENSKSIEKYQEIISLLIDSGFTRDVQLIALGGGVVGDLTGFIASTFMRGVDFIQIPTTLLSQIDSSVGGKVAVNFKRKNIIGSFIDPKIVLIDPNTLNTLSPRQFNNGMAEAIKYGLIKDKELFYKIVNKNYDIEELIYRCLEIKKEIVLQDQFDYGIRHILNFGHTIAHGIEIQSDFEILHGEAVGIGMYIISKDDSIKEEIKNVLIKYNLPTFYNYEINNLYELLINDKKVFNDYINIVLLKDIGEAYIKKIKLKELKNYL